MHKKISIVLNQSGVSPILETLVAVGISIALLVIFFVSTTNIFTSHDKPNIDVKAKCISITETLINTPGSASGYDYDWQDKPDNIDFAGLATTQLIAFGKANISDDGEVDVISYNTTNKGIGIIQTCFLAGTKIVLVDGSYKNIEDIKVGDIVKSYDEKTGKTTDGKVTKIFHHNPAEMGEYYLVINKQLRVTPNHMFYSNGKWIYASDLKIGDPLFYASNSQSIYSIEKIYKQELTYNFEVKNNHNYFVALDETDMLVHNDAKQQDPDQQPSQPQGYPTANFNWFDTDGPYSPSTVIFLNAESSDDNSYPITTYYWYFNHDIEKDGIPTRPPDISGSLPYAEWNPGDGIHYVTLNVTNSKGSDYYSVAVEANQPETYVIEQKPWVLTGKNVYPSVDGSTLMAYGENYYIKYTPIEDESGANWKNYIFEIKEKTKSPYTIIDLDKIENLSNLIYYDVKSALGLETQNYMLYNFNITLVTQERVYYYGASFNYTDLLETVKKEVLVYYKPIYAAGSPSVIKEPYYQKGDITVRVFIGGTVPNYPPRKPYDPSPADKGIGVGWNVDLTWKGDDINPEDTVTYDVYFGTNNPPSPVPPGGQTATNYDPGMLNHNTQYYWKIVAHDNHGTSTAGPIWHFTTKPNTAPDQPSNPDPLNETTDVNIRTNLSWYCYDPDVEMGDILTYEVLFGKNSGHLSTISCPNWQQPYFNPKENCSEPDLIRLDYNTKYYWQIKVKDLYRLMQPPIPGPIWNFWTAEKGLDQYTTYSSNTGYNTLGGIGQTFIAGDLKWVTGKGNLSSIKLSLKTINQANGENILVEIYECYGKPVTEKEYLKTSTVISSFSSASYIWKQVNFSPPVEVEEGRTYFVLIKTDKDNYNLEYSREIFNPEPYPYGEAWKFEGDWIEIKPSEDFMFKTYVFRPFILDQYCNKQISIGRDIEDGFAQTFLALIPGDLMKINLSFAQEAAAPEDDITVTIYKGITRWEKDPLATTTIQGFGDTSGKFVWKEANFTNKPPYIEQGQIYSIVVTSTNGLYKWETPDADAYPLGMAYIYDSGSGKWDDLPSMDMIFLTYMDTIDT